MMACNNTVDDTYGYEYGLLCMSYLEWVVK